MLRKPMNSRGLAVYRRYSASSYTLSLVICAPRPNSTDALIEPPPNSSTAAATDASLSAIQTSCSSVRAAKVSSGRVSFSLAHALYDIKEVSMTIFQPRRENVSTWTIPIEKLKVWAEEELKPKAQKAYDGDGEYVPGEWCTFCKAAVKCRARAEEKMKLARMEFKMPPLLTDAEIEEVLTVLPDLTKWANEITAYATEAAIHHLGLDDAKNEMIRMEELEQARKEVDKTEGKKPMKQNMFKVV